MKLYIANAFSLNMLDRELQKVNPRIPIPINDPIAYLRVFQNHAIPIESAIGHADTAKIISDLLQMELPMNRINIKINNGVAVLIGQYSGPRLPEGTTELHPCSKFSWWAI